MKKESYITQEIFCLLNLSKDLLTPEKLNSSPLWNEAYTEEEAKERKGVFYKYTIKFDGTKPIQCTNIQRIDF